MTRADATPAVGEMDERAALGGFYSPRVAAKVARIRYQNFQAWAKASLLHPKKVRLGKREESVYTYADLLLIRLILRLRQHEVRPKAIKTALKTITALAEGDPHAWMKATMYVESGMIVVVFPDREDWNPIAASKGTQKLSLVFFPELREELEHELVPPERFPFIEIDPQVLGGMPVVRGTRVSTRSIAEVAASGEDPVKAYPELKPDQIRNARDYEEFLAAA